MESMMLKEIDELRALFLDTEFTPQVLFESLVSSYEEQIVIPVATKQIAVRRFDVNLRRIEF